MLKARKVLDENFGNIYINFGQPFSLREAAYNRVDRSRFACTPLFDQFVSEESELFVQELSLYAIARIQENIYIQPWHLIASVLFNYAFCNHNRALPAMLLVEKVNQLSNLLKNVNCKQIMTSHSLTDVISVLECHHKTVHFCTFSKMFLLAPEELYFTKEGKTVPIIPVQLLMYQNMFVNHLAPLFIAVNIVECQGSFISKQEFDHKWKLALSIFTQEFVAIENDPIQVLEVLESQKVTFYDTRSEIISLNLESYKLKNLLNDVARPYFTILYLTVANLYSYSLVSQSIGEYKFDSLASLNSSVRSKITQCYDSGKLSGVAAVTTAAVNNVFNLCKSRNIIVTKKKQGTTIIQVDQSKCSNLLNEIQQIFPCDQFMFAMSSIKSKL
ncbi:dihydroxyacetone phosphate acyltransferase-like [Symsagittifera roscoffensis]